MRVRDRGWGWVSKSFLDRIRVLSNEFAHLRKYFVYLRCFNIRKLINILTCEISPMSCTNTLLHIITKFITKINLQINCVSARTKYLFSPSMLTANGNTVI